MLSLRPAFTVDLPGECLLMSFAALPSARAAAVICSRDGRCSLMLVDGATASFRPIDDTLVAGAVELPGRADSVQLARLGDGFALLTTSGVTRWTHFDAAPRRFRRVDSFPENQHGYRVGVYRGGFSDDPDAALVLLREPQTLDGATRFALLRFDDATGDARWEWTLPDGEPPALDKEDFPIPEFWRSSPSFDSVRPFLDHGSWAGQRLRLFALGGLTPSFERWGMDYSIAAVVEGRRVVERWAAPEPSWGLFTSSGRYLITRPLRARGPSKGAACLVDLDSNEPHALALPRGFSRYVPADHCDGTFWLTHTHAWTCRIAAFVGESAGAGTPR
jgi:hypothetical protein